MDDMAETTGMAYEGMPFPPIPNEERYAQLAEAFFAIPATPDQRLQRDIWNRMNHLNTKKLDQLRKKTEEQAKLQAKLEQKRRQAEEQAERRQNGEDLEVTERIPKRMRRRLSKQYWVAKRKSFAKVYRLSITPWIQKLVRAGSYVSWLWVMATFREYPKHGFPFKPNILLP